MLFVDINGGISRMLQESGDPPWSCIACGVVLHCVGV